MNANDRLLKAIQARGQKREPFAHGIHTADKYVRTLLENVGADVCNRYGSTSHFSFDDMLRKAASTLTYSNLDMTLDHIEYENRGAKIKKLPGGIDLPKNTLMVFQHVLTTPRKDRDGDILRTQGATVDPGMLLLWQHVHTMPIGKMLKEVKHNSKKLTLISAIVDINEVSHDAAVMIDNKMGRFSHGFRAIDFEEMKGDEGGFDIKEFEIMEASLVSVPSNVDAETEDILLSLLDGGKLTSPVMREYGETIRRKRPVVLPVELELELTDKSKETLKEIQDANKSGGGAAAAEEGGADSGPSKEADENDKENKAKEAGMSEVTRETMRRNLELMVTEAKSRNVPIKRMVGRTGTAAGHDHPVVLDDEGTGVAQQADGHTHKVAEFKVQPANGHSHSLSKGDLEERSKYEMFKDGYLEFVREECDRIKKEMNRPNEKGGRALSKANEAKIKDAKENVDEVIKMDISRPAKAGLREASGNLKTVLGALGEEESSVESITVEKAFEVVQNCGTYSQKHNMWKILGIELKAEKSKKRTKQFRAFKKHG